MPANTPAPSPAAHKLERLRELFPQAVEIAPDGSVRVNAAAIQQVLNPAIDVHDKTKINNDSLAQLVQQIDPSLT